MSTPFYDTTAWDALEMLPIAPFVATTVLDHVRRSAVPGSHLRYLLATAQWTCVGLGAVLPLLLLVEASGGWRAGDAGHAASALFGVLACCLVLVPMGRHLVEDGDDHWFTRTGRRVRHTLRTARLTRLRTVEA